MPPHDAADVTAYVWIPPPQVAVQTPQLPTQLTGEQHACVLHGVVAPCVNGHAVPPPHAAVVTEYVRVPPPQVAVHVVLQLPTQLVRQHCVLQG